MEGYVLFVIGMIILILILVWAYKSDDGSIYEELEKNNVNTNEKDRYSTLKKRYTYTQEYINPDFSNSILVDEEKNTITVFNNEMNDIHSFKSKDIIQIEIIKDGEVITTTNRKNQIGGAIIGSLFAGDTGAIIGGLSASSSTQEKIREINLKISVDNTSRPNLFVNFFNNRDFVSVENSIELRKSLKDIEHWYSILNILIERSKKGDTSVNNSSIVLLDRLVELYREGMLTKEEFEAEKKKILKN